jgi:hypothetical protein
MLKNSKFAKLSLQNGKVAKWHCKNLILKFKVQKDMIKSFTLNNTSDSILSRFCLVSLIWLLLILGGFTSRAWANYTWIARVGVDQGKGAAKIEIYNNAAKIFGGQKSVAWSEVATSSTSLKNCTTTVVAASTNGWPICTVVTDSTGYSFSGWYHEGTKVSDDRTYNTYGYFDRNWDKTYYARFTANSYDITLAPNGGSGNNQTIRATYDSGMPGTLKNSSDAIVAPTRTGYTFTGYFDNTSGGTKYYNANLSSARNWDKASTATLSAQWSVNNYTITLTAGSGTTSAGTTSITATFDASTNLTSAITKPTKTGNVFDGYYTGAGGTGTQIIDAFGNVIAQAGGDNTYTDADRKWKYANNIELYANWISKYTPVFEYEGNTTMKVGETQNDVFSFTHVPVPVATIRVVSIDAIQDANYSGKVIEYIDNKIYARNAGVARLVINQVENDTITEGESDSITITVTKNVSSINGTLGASNLMVDGGTSIGSYTTSNVETGDPTADDSNYYYTISQTLHTPTVTTGCAAGHSSHVIGFNPSTKAITAYNAGSATLTITQKETYRYTGFTKSFTVTVHKYGNSYSVANLNTTVDDDVVSTYSWTYTKPNAAYPGIAPTEATPVYGTSTTKFYYTLSHDIQTDNTIGTSIDTVIAYVPGTKTATGRNKGESTIHLYQPETYKIAAADRSFTVSVAKHDPDFHWNPGGATYYYNSKIYDVFTTESPCAYRFSSSNTASMIATKGEKDTLIIYNVKENATITVTQDENYKWNGDTKNYTITPVNQNNHVPFTVTGANKGTFVTVAEDDAEWNGDNGYKMGAGKIIMDNAPYSYIIIQFVGIPDKLTFRATCDKVGIGVASSYPIGNNYYFDVYESEDGSFGDTPIWSNPNRGTKYSEIGEQNYTVQLAPTTRYVKLRYHGTCYGHFRNINVTELYQFSATPALMDFGTKGVNFGTQVEPVVFNHANAGRITTMEIVGDDAAYFSIERSTIPGTGRDLYATTSIEVSFDNKKGPAGHDPEYSAVLHIEDNAGHFLNIPLSGVRDGKTEPEFSFNANHLPYFVGTNIANVASSSNTDYANCPLTFETSDASIAQVIDGTLHIYNKKESVTITIRQGENKDFSAGVATFTFTPRERPERTVPMQLVKSIYNEGTVEAGGRCKWLDDDGGCIRVGNNNTVIDDWIWYHSEKNFTIAFDGQPGRLSFEYKNTGWLVTMDPSGNHTYQVQESSDGASWNTVWYADATTTEWTSVKEVTLNPSTRYLRFSFSGNYWGFYRNINISELVGYKYLRAESDGRYLSRGAKWGTQAIVDDFGMACRISNYTNDNTNFYTRFLFVDNQQYLYEADNHEMFTDDGTAANTYNLWKQNVVDGTIITFQSGNDYPSDSHKDQYVTLDGDALALTADAAAATRWQMEDYTEHEAYITAMMNREAAAAAAIDFGTSVNTLAQVRTEIAENDFEITPVDIPALALGEQKGEYRSGEAGTNAVYDNTISGLTPGFYRLTVKAFYRISSADVAWTCHAAGMESVLAYIYANDVAYPIQSLYKSYHVSPLEASDELRGGHYYSTDLASADIAFGDEKRYLNDVYVYVEADAGKTTGTLRYGIKNPSYVPGAWLVYKDITLTRIARKQYIFNGNVDEEWTTDGSWNRGSQPNIHHEVIIDHDVIIESEIAAYSLTINEGKTVTIAPNGGLTIGAGGVRGASAEKLILKAGTAEDGALKGQTGYLRISPYSTQPMPEATVELYTIGYYNMNVGNHQDVGTWQYVGSPVVGGTAAKSVFTQSMIYDWNESKGEWKNNRRNLILQPFTGYATSQYNEEGRLVTTQGQLVDNGEVVLPLSYTESSATPGCNVFANSFTAPIDISKLEASDFSEGVDATIHLFNTGSKTDVAAHSSESPEDVDVNAAGQYLSIPVINAGVLHSEFGYPLLIPAMQGFYVNTDREGTLTLNYEKLVWNTNLTTNPNTPLRAPKKSNEEEEQIVSGTLQVTLATDGMTDNLFLLEAEHYDASFENGYDARKKMSCAFNIFSVVDDEHLAVDATNSIIGTRVGVRTGDETAYTVVFGKVRSENELALLDFETNQTIDINEGTAYTFFAEPNSMIEDRFEIVERENVPAITTDIENVEKEPKAHKFIKDNQLFILKNGVLYNATGAVVR